MSILLLDCHNIYVARVLTEEETRLKNNMIEMCTILEQLTIAKSALLQGMDLALLLEPMHDLLFELQMMERGLCLSPQNCISCHTRVLA